MTDKTLLEKYHICKGINPPHPIDEYHFFLIRIQEAKKILESVKGLREKLPSLKIQYEHTLDSLKRLNDEALIC